MRLITQQCPLTAVAHIDAQVVYHELKRKWPFGDSISDEHIAYALVYALNLLYHERLYLEYSPEQWGTFVELLLKANIYSDAQSSSNSSSHPS